MRRFAPLLTVAILCSQALADDRAEIASRMRSAMADVAQQTRLTLSLEGLQVVGKQETPFLMVASWSAVPTKTGVPIKLEMRAYRGGKPVQTVVADGTFLWIHSLDRKEYVCVQYGATEGPPPADAAIRLLRQLSSRLRGQSSYLVRLLQEAYVPAAPTQYWTPWLPLATAELDVDTVATTIGDPPIQTMDFRLLPPDPDAGQPEYRLDKVDYWETGKQGRDLRTITWTLRVIPDAFATGTTFRFVPPPDARPISERGRVSDT